MNSTEVAQACEAWAVNNIEGLHSYEHMPRSLAQALPLVIGEIQNKKRQSINTTEPQFQQYSFQQTAVIVWDVDLLFMIDPSDSWTASQTLYDMTDTLGDLLEKDPTLGGLVNFASEDYEVSFTPPEYEHADGTIARVATMSIVVGFQKGV